MPASPPSSGPFIGPRESDEWEPLYASDPRFQDDDYEVIFATTRSVN